MSTPKVENSELYRYAQILGCDFVFYDKFIQICNDRGVSPSRAATEAGLSKSTVTKWKNTPDSEPTGAALKKLSDYFCVSIAELLGEKAQKEKPTVSGELVVDMSDVDVAFYGGYKELSEDDQKVIRDMVRVMRERRSKKEAD